MQSSRFLVQMLAFLWDIAQLESSKIIESDFYIFFIIFVPVFDCLSCRYTG